MPQHQYIQRFPINGKRYVPIIRVSFHTEGQCYQTTGKFVGMDGKPDPTDQVLSVTTTKTMGSPAGAFTIQLAGEDWLGRLKSNDLVVIQMGYKTSATSEAMNTVMVGLIDTVSRFRTVADNHATVTTTIQGRDFGKMLIKSQLRFYPELGWNDNRGQKFFLTEQGWITLMKAFTSDNAVKGTPAKILDTIMRFILQKIVAVQWTVYDESKATPVPKTVELGHILRYNFAEVPIFLPLIMTAQQYEGSVWNLMERASVKPFTELFVDVREGSEAWNPGGSPRVVNETIEESSSPDKGELPKDEGWYPPVRQSFGKDGAAVMVILRNTPFDKGAWEKLYTHDLPAEDVMSENLSISDNEHYNLFWAGTNITPFSSMDLRREAPPLMNEDNVKRYGLSPLEVNIEGMLLDKGQESTQRGTLVTNMKQFSARLKAWYEKNHEYMTGSMSVRGKGNYKIGHRLLRKGIEREFYIEGVTQSFSVYMDWTTELQLTRGMLLTTAPDSAAYMPPKSVVSISEDVTVTITEATGDQYYTVQSGDNLHKIAGQFGTTASAVWEANKDMLIARDGRNASTKGSYIYVGQQLRIPK